MLFNVTDTFWVGRTLGPDALAAVSLASYTVWIIVSLGELVGVGLTAVAARRHGEGDPQSAARAAGTALVMALVLGVVVAAGGLLSLPAIFRLMHAEGVVAELAREFLVIQLLGAALIYGYFVVTAAFRSAGDTRTPFVLLGASVLLNLVLDPLMILGWGPLPALGVYGAALATVLTRGLGFLVGIVLLYRRGGIRLSLSLPVARSIARIGLPTMLTGVLFSAIYMLLVRVVGRFGTPAIAALGVGHKIEGISYMICVGFGLAAETLVGQNLGAGQNGARAAGGMGHGPDGRRAGQRARRDLPALAGGNRRHLHYRCGGHPGCEPVPARRGRRPARGRVRERPRGRADRRRLHAVHDGGGRRDQRAPHPARRARGRPVRAGRHLVDARAHRHGPRGRHDRALALGRMGEGAGVSALPWSMPLLTLLTDFGSSDSYVAEIKGVLLGRCPAATLVDVSHAVPPGDIRSGAYLLGRAWHRFPPGTVHLAVVDPGVGTARAALALRAHGPLLRGSGQRAVHAGPARCGGRDRHPADAGRSRADLPRPRPLRPRRRRPRPGPPL